MRCRVCGGLLEPRVTDLPFKIADFSIVIVKALPVLQCKQCGDTELENTTMLRVDQLLARIDRSAELEVIRYPASARRNATLLRFRGGIDSLQSNA